MRERGHLETLTKQMRFSFGGVVCLKSALGNYGKHWKASLDCSRQAAKLHNEMHQWLRNLEMLLG